MPLRYDIGLTGRYPELKVSSFLNDQKWILVLPLTTTRQWISLTHCDDAMGRVPGARWYLSDDVVTDRVMACRRYLSI